MVHGDQCVWTTTSLLLMLALLADSCLDFVLTVYREFVLCDCLVHFIVSHTPLAYSLVMQAYSHFYVSIFPVCCSFYYKQ